MTAKRILKEYEERTGWSDKSKIIVLCRFIDDLDPGYLEAFRAHVEKIAKLEEEPA